MAFFLPASWFKISSVQLTINQTKPKKNYCMQHVYRGTYVFIWYIFIFPVLFLWVYLSLLHCINCMNKNWFFRFSGCIVRFWVKKNKNKNHFRLFSILVRAIMLLIFFFYFVSLLNIIKNLNVHYLQRLSWYLFLIMCNFVFVAHLRLEHTRDFTHK